MAIRFVENYLQLYDYNNRGYIRFVLDRLITVHTERNSVVE